MYIEWEVRGVFFSLSEMGSLSLILFILYCLIHASSALPLCADSRAPATANTSLSFCPYNGTACCDETQDLLLLRQFRDMNIADRACASVVKSILCAKCDPYSLELFEIQSLTRTLPILCNSTNNFCSKVWDTCQNITIKDSPFAPQLEGSAGGQVNSSAATKLADLWQTKDDFCHAFGGHSSNQSMCYDGNPVSMDDNTNQTELVPPGGLCLERIGNGSYLDMAPHPDGTDRAFFSDQKGMIYLATIPEAGSGGTMELDESDPFLDLTDEVYFDTLFGLMSIAFHPNFKQNGRLFAAFNCDKTSWISCSGRCSCNSNVGCDPSKLLPHDDSQPCRFHVVVAEYTANSSASLSPSQVKNANPTEVRRIFTMGLPFAGHHIGKLMFGPEDGHLYVPIGDGGSKGDPYNFAQNKKSLLGKMMRLNIDNIPSEKEIRDRGLWGNYTIPTDNPYTEDKDSQPEIWALGLRNSWRCSFDAERPSYLFCGDVGQEVYEEVDLITKGGNYGWRVYEGPSLYTTLGTPGRNTTARSIDPIFPIMGYTHADVNNKVGSASIIGGYVYHASADPCMSGRYLYADLYGGAMWAGTETPENSGNFTSTSIPFRCAKSSPIPCDSVPGSPLPSLGYVYSFGQDNKKDVFLLTSSGVYRVVRPSRCNFTCSREIAVADTVPSPTSSPSSAYKLEDQLGRKWFTLFSSLLILLGFVL